ncbi:MAG: 1-acyl-sn-glycerol-3-phosphate acyltransferase [Proteobacteria bacterium]|nr:1-acyl-sn-glycerol-3-phosphate acyltransferase [Pseudomonadota bacterium]
MNGHIAIPVWLFVLLIIVTCAAVLDRVLIPSTRWFIRRRINRVIDEISTRLDIEIRPFQLTKRQVLIDRLVYDPKVIEAVQAYAQEKKIPREVAQAKVITYAKEIVPSFNAYLYFRIGYWVAKKAARLLYRVRVGFVDNEDLAKVDPKSTVVFVMNHRSNMDYVLVAFLAAERTTLSYAVGEWAKIWPLQMLIKYMGAFFVRRNSGNRLYRQVLERYIHMATKEGVCQAVFIEGGLTRDGCLRPPKLGLLDYMLRGFQPEDDRDVVFIPVGINYDRTIEDRSLLRELDPQAEKRSVWFVFKTTAGFILHNLLLMIQNKWHRFGFACVNFGPHISARKHCRENGINFGSMTREARFREVEKLSYKLLDSIKTIIPVLPVPLASTVLLENRSRWISEFDLKARIFNLIEELKSKGVTVNVPDKNRESVIEIALNMLRIRKMFIESDGLIRADAGMIGVLSYYANSIVQWRQENDMKVAVDLKKKDAQEEIIDVSRLKKKPVPSSS